MWKAALKRAEGHIAGVVPGVNRWVMHGGTTLIIAARTGPFKSTVLKRKRITPIAWY